MKTTALVIFVALLTVHPTHAMSHLVDDELFRPFNAVATPEFVLAQFGGLSRHDVLMLQSSLNSLGFDAGKPDGIMGRRTRAALTQFQHAYGVAATGRMDGPTAAAMERAISGAMEREQPLPGNPVSRQVQAYHHDISQERFVELERLLKELGYNPGEIDGVVSEETHRAIAAFQRDRDMDATGLVDGNTEAGIQETHADMLFYGTETSPAPTNPGRSSEADQYVARTDNRPAASSNATSTSQIQEHHEALTAEERRHVQMMLNLIGFDGGVPGEPFTDIVHDSLSRFQAVGDLPVNGLVGIGTLSALARSALKVVDRYVPGGRSSQPTGLMDRYEAYAERQAH
jgi:peptidoglycan hydrolase-like protein with peptidoglycan-binding domain